MPAIVVEESEGRTLMVCLPGDPDSPLLIGPDGRFTPNPAVFTRTEASYTPPEARREPPPMPSLARQAVNFTRAAVRHVAAGRPKASDEVKAARLAICRECEFYVPETIRCRAAGCGCYLAVKTGWAAQSCPLDPPKWGPVAGQ